MEAKAPPRGAELQAPPLLPPELASPLPRCPSPAPPHFRRAWHRRWWWTPASVPPAAAAAASASSSLLCSAASAACSPAAPPKIPHVAVAGLASSAASSPIHPEGRAVALPARPSVPGWLALPTSSSVRPPPTGGSSLLVVAAVMAPRSRRSAAMAPRLALSLPRLPLALGALACSD